jgi:uncharacterized membrane protein YidH (DUF202 family)
MGENDVAGRHDRNRGQVSVVQTYLATQRTLLAWFRTALTAMTCGMALAAFLPFEPASGNGLQAAMMLATLLVAGGLALLLVCTRV